MTNILPDPGVLMLLRHRLAAVFALLMLATPVTAAQAAAQVPPHVTLADARASMPARATALHLPQHGAGTTHVAEGLIGCHVKDIDLNARGTAFADYQGTDGPDTVVLFVNAYVYATTAQAAAVEKPLARDQLNCPRTQTLTNPSATVHLTETVDTAYTASGWQGLRKLDHEVLITAAGTQHFRVFQVWLTRGNVVLYIVGRVTDSPGRGALQWHWVQEAQAQVLTALNS